MKNSKLKITSHTLGHPEATTEGSAKLFNCADSSLSLRMTEEHFEFLIREAI